MISFSKLENNLLKEFNIKDTSNAYVLKKDEIILGYGIITNNSKNQIEIFIKEEFRSNGYGKILFGKMLNILKEKGYKEIKLTFTREKYRIKSIIESFGGLHLHTDESNEVYLILIK